MAIIYRFDLSNQDELCRSCDIWLTRMMSHMVTMCHLSYKMWILMPSHVKLQSWESEAHIVIMWPLIVSLFHTNVSNKVIMWIASSHWKLYTQEMSIRIGYGERLHRNLFEDKLCHIIKLLTRFLQLNKSYVESIMWSHYCSHVMVMWWPCYGHMITMWQSCDNWSEQIEFGLQEHSSFCAKYLSGRLASS